MFISIVIGLLPVHQELRSEQHNCQRHTDEDRPNDDSAPFRHGWQKAFGINPALILLRMMSVVIFLTSFCKLDNESLSFLHTLHKPHAMHTR
jgi:hypothetical protein